MDLSELLSRASGDCPSAEADCGSGAWVLSLRRGGTAESFPALRAFGACNKRFGDHDILMKLQSGGSVSAAAIMLLTSTRLGSSPAKSWRCSASATTEEAR